MNLSDAIATMHVRVLFFGVLKDLAGRDSESLSLPDAATLADVLRHYRSRIPQLEPALSSIAMSLNQEYAPPDRRLNDGDEIGLLPPVSGGRETQPGSSPHALASNRASIVRTKIDTGTIVEQLKRPADGAVVVFEGVVRDHTRGRPTRYLEYEAYEEMALKQMDTLTANALAQFQVHDLAIVHRLGRLEIGETSVLVVVASAHRAAAFDACRWLIDTLKRTVPIWKKEFFEDGAVWADGEPFPAEIPHTADTYSERPASK